MLLRISRTRQLRKESALIALPKAVRPEHFFGTDAGSVGHDRGVMEQLDRWLTGSGGANPLKAILRRLYVSKL
jgi:hypothetical protein